jgi:hypothetical protein
VVDIEPFVMTVPDYTESPPQFRQVSVDEYGTVLASALVGEMDASVLPDILGRSYELSIALTKPIVILDPNNPFGEAQTSCVTLTIAPSGLVTMVTQCNQIQSPL